MLPRLISDAAILATATQLVQRYCYSHLQRHRDGHSLIVTMHHDGERSVVVHNLFFLFFLKTCGTFESSLSQFSIAELFQGHSLPQAPAAHPHQKNLSALRGGINGGTADRRHRDNGVLSACMLITYHYQHLGCLLHDLYAAESVLIQSHRKKWLKEHYYAKVGKELQGEGAQWEQRGCCFAEGQEKRKENFLYGQFWVQWTESAHSCM